jgi:hypothetical protein
VQAWGASLLDTRKVEAAARTASIDAASCSCFQDGWPAAGNEETQTHTHIPRGKTDTREQQGLGPAPSPNTQEKGGPTARAGRHGLQGRAQQSKAVRHGPGQSVRNGHMQKHRVRPAAGCQVGPAGRVGAIVW